MADERPSELAVCYGCGKPLISTFMFAGYEWYCFCCGRLYTMFGAQTVSNNDKLWEQYQLLLNEWKAEVGPFIITPRSYKRGCDKCMEDECRILEPHDQHATEEERKADREAREYMKRKIAL